MIQQRSSCKYNYLFFLSLILYSCGATSDRSDRTVENEHDSPAGSKWAGTITYRHTQTSYHAAPNTETMYHIWNHSYQQVMDAKVTDDKGTATSSITLLDTSYYREQIGSRTVEQWTIDKGNAQGSGNTDVNISINPGTNTYSIEVPIPATTGNKTRTNLCKGCGQQPDAPTTSGMGEDETSILVEDQKMGNDPNVLTGEKTERKKIDNGEGEEVSITKWMFTKSGK